ncbi:hypothetical protein PT974_08399 [Cladobotryum mycophilum]|uniref:Uncharacterized protein n=1 Tax=Cladobotryum mycophilum TaxID=491253 RepID=A0ABR0SDA0_9HYPO
MVTILQDCLSDLDKSINRLSQGLEEAKNLVSSLNDPKHWDHSSASSTIMTAGCMTPTQSEFSETSMSGRNPAISADLVRLHAPLEPGRTYIIRSRNEKKVLTVCEGELKLIDGYAFGGWLWATYKESNWMDAGSVNRLALAKNIDLLQQQHAYLQSLMSKLKMMNEHPDDDASAASASAAGEMTPTQSELSYANDRGVDIATSERPADKEYFPSAGKTFIISSRVNNQILTLLDGELEVFDGYAFGGSWLWRCFKSDNWYKFYNTASGRRLCYDGRSFLAPTWDEEWQQFTAHRHENGGYVLLVKCEQRLVQMGVGSIDNTLIGVDDEGVAWDFIEVNRPPVSDHPY